MVAAGWSDAKKRAYMLADNKLTLNGEWDLERLAIEIAELRASDFDISLIGFSESEIDDLLKADGDGGPGAGSLADPPVQRAECARRLVAGAQGGVVGVRHSKRARARGEQRAGRLAAAARPRQGGQSFHWWRPIFSSQAHRRAGRVEDAGGRLWQDARARRRAREVD
jgi:hypothetical protein